VIAVLFCSYCLVYIIFLIHGVAVLMPWNMFINANDVSCLWSAINCIDLYCVGRDIKPYSLIHSLTVFLHNLSVTGFISLEQAYLFLYW